MYFSGISVPQSRTETEDLGFYLASDLIPAPLSHGNGRSELLCGEQGFEYTSTLGV